MVRYVNLGRRRLQSFSLLLLNGKLVQESSPSAGSLVKTCSYIFRPTMILIVRIMKAHPSVVRNKYLEIPGLGIPWASGDVGMAFPEGIGLGSLLGS